MARLDPMSDSPLPSVPPPARDYCPPTIVALGAIDTVTAGPSSAGELDTLFGGDGGFREPDTTS